MRRFALCATFLLIGLAAPALAEEQHPTIEHAITALEQTKAELANGEHGFGGHRSKAIENIDTALKELHLALDYAQAHPEEIKPAGQ